MRINTNIASLQAQRYLSNTTKALSRALERLSSGKRITRAGDDAAGLAISEGLQSQVRGLRQVARNINDAFGFLNTADGAIATQTDIVQRMRELAIQSANGTLGVQERANLDNEFQTLLEEFDRIAEQTQFNGVNLLDGSFGTQSIQVGTNKGETVAFNIGSTRSAEAMPNETLESTVEGLGTFTNSQILTSGDVSTYDMKSGDINEDGYDDILVASLNSGEGSTIYFGSANGSLTASDTAAFWGNQVALKDVNNDGHLDVIAKKTPTVMGVHLGDGSGSFASAITFATTLGGDISIIELADVNEDSNLDILAVYNNQLSISLGSGDGNFVEDSVLAFASNFNSLRVGDMNGDGHVDIVANTLAAITISSGNGLGAFGAQVFASNDTGWAGLELADLNNDGNLDIIGPRFFNLGNGNGTFGANQMLMGDIGSHDAIVVRDFNNDGYLDILKPKDNYYRIGFGNASANYTSYVQYTPSGSGDLRANAVGDFNGDGAIDISMLNIGSDQSFVYYQDTSTTTTGVSIDLDITTQAHAQNILDLLDDGLEYLAAARANIGAIQNRLEYSAANTSVMTENLAQARSQILDADIAEETAELTRAQILQQAGVSVLGQANTSMQLVLSLLGGLRR